MATTRISLLPALFEPPIARDFDSMRNRLRQFFPDSFGRALLEPSEFLTEPVGWMPAVELTENAEDFVVVAELPGLKPADVTVECEDDTLTIRGTKEEEKKAENGTKRVHLYERSFGTFFRSFAFPKPVNAEKVVAEFANGVLTIHIPKAAEVKSAARKVEIKEIKAK
jgi:HSP20 family protein